MLHWRCQIYATLQLTHDAMSYWRGCALTDHAYATGQKPCLPCVENYCMRVKHSFLALAPACPGICGCQLARVHAAACVGS